MFGRHVEYVGPLASKGRRDGVKRYVQAPAQVSQPVEKLDVSNISRRWYRRLFGTVREATTHDTHPGTTSMSEVGGMDGLMHQGGLGVIGEEAGAFVECEPTDEVAIK